MRLSFLDGARVEDRRTLASHINASVVEFIKRMMESIVIFSCDSSRGFKGTPGLPLLSAPIIFHLASSAR